MTRTAIKSLAWDYGILAVEQLAGKLGPVLFTLPDGRPVAPLHVADWFHGDDADIWPGIRRLRGDWACVPFGFDADRPAFGDWPASSAATAIDGGHGFGNSSDWTFTDVSETRIALAIDYPAEHPIARLERTITPDPNAPAIDLTLTIHPRRDCRLPIAVHPTFRLPNVPGGAVLEFPPDTDVATLPSNLAPTAVFARGVFAPIAAVPDRAGGTVDGRRVPFAQPSGDLLQVLRPKGAVSLLNAVEGYRAKMRWDPAAFPSLLVWMSFRAHPAPPWNGRHLALGLEPICSAFDQGTGMATRDNPINARGIPTAHDFRAGEAFTTAYRIEVEGA